MDNSFEIQIAGSHLQPNEKYLFGVFSPDGEPRGAVEITSNGNSDLYLPDGSRNKERFKVIK